MRRLRRLGKEPTASFTRLATALPTRPSLSRRFALSRRMKAFLACILRDSLLKEMQHRNIVRYSFLHPNLTSCYFYLNACISDECCFLVICVCGFNW
ncbi:hypothetical protein AHAS_Ahas20G0188400 [Arachis hypogaea]